MKKDEKRICFLHVGMARDGAERVIAHLANNYAEQGYVVDIIVLLLDYCGYKLHPKVNIISFVREGKPRYRNILYWILNIRKYIKKMNPIHVISFSMYVNIFTLLACVGLKKDILISERNDPSSDGRNIFSKVLTWILYPNANKIVFQTKRAQGCFSKTIQKKSRIIGNPISVGCNAIDQKVNKIVTVGRLAPQKNHEMLLKAFSICHEHYPELLLEIYGVGILLDRLKRQVEELGISENVIFKGSKSNVHEYLKDAKMFVLSSDYEGLSNALLEAMMMGLPCISTNCAGSDEVIKDGENGLLVEIGDYTSLAAAIEKLLVDANLCQRISRNAIESVSIYSTPVILKKWYEYIES